MRIASAATLATMGVILLASDPNLYTYGVAVFGLLNLSFVLLELAK